MLGQSAYDRTMERMHNYTKESEEFYTVPEGVVEIHFKPKSCWMVFADMAGHSCKSGSFAVINTFIVPVPSAGAGVNQHAHVADLRLPWAFYFAVY